MTWKIINIVRSGGGGGNDYGSADEAQCCRFAVRNNTAWGFAPRILFRSFAIFAFVTRAGHKKIHHPVYFHPGRRRRIANVVQLFSAYADVSAVAGARRSSAERTDARPSDGNRSWRNSADRARGPAV